MAYVAGVYWWDLDPQTNSMTLSGGTPYQGWGQWKVVHELMFQKYRMPQPAHVSDQLYV